MQVSVSMPRKLLTRFGGSLITGVFQVALYPNEACLFIAGLVRSELVGAKLRLAKTPFQGVTPTTTRAQLVAAEADFTGYPAGGAVIAAFLAPLLAPLGGASIDWPTVQFAPASPFTVGNTVKSWWIETADGDLIACGDFPETIPMSQAGNGFPLNGSLTFPNGG